MKPFTIILYVAAIAFGAFGYWGVFTIAGRREYDEMAGIIPGFALLVAGILLLIALILTLVLFIRARKRKTQ